MALNLLSLADQNHDKIVQFHQPKMYTRTNLHKRMKTNSREYDFFLSPVLTLSQKDVKMREIIILTKNNKTTFFSN